MFGWMERDYQRTLMNRSHPVLARAVVWLDDDGRHVWFAHDCAEGRVETMLPHPTWIADPVTDDVRPAIDCRECGTHAYFNLRTDAPSGGISDASEPSDTMLLLCIYCRQTIDHRRAEPAPLQCLNPRCGRWTCYIEWSGGEQNDGAAKPGAQSIEELRPETRHRYGVEDDL